MERRRLIGTGIDHKQIKLQKDRILVDNSLHASIKDSKLKLHEPTTSSATNKSSPIVSPSHHSLRLDKIDANGSSSIVSNTPDAHHSSPGFQSPPLLAKSQSDNAKERK